MTEQLGIRAAGQDRFLLCFTIIDRFFGAFGPLYPSTDPGWMMYADGWMMDDGWWMMEDDGWMMDGWMIMDDGWMMDG